MCCAALNEILKLCKFHEIFRIFYQRIFSYSLPRSISSLCYLLCACTIQKILLTFHPILTSLRRHHFAKFHRRCAILYLNFLHIVHMCDVMKKHNLNLIKFYSAVEFCIIELFIDKGVRYLGLNFWKLFKVFKIYLENYLKKL